MRGETEFRKVDLVGSALEHGLKACAMGHTRGVADEIADQRHAFVKRHQTPDQQGLLVGETAPTE
jgi:hypothetical protein